MVYSGFVRAQSGWSKNSIKYLKGPQEYGIELSMSKQQPILSIVCGQLLLRYIFIRSITHLRTHTVTFIRRMVRTVTVEATLLAIVTANALDREVSSAPIPFLAPSDLNMLLYI